MEQFVNFVIRPPRADYSQQDLLEREFSLKGRIYQRKDLEITNSKGQLLHCSHYMPRFFPADTQFPCVIYCHGNSGCRADGNEAAIVLLPSNITVFTIDFSGSGLSDGDYVTLGWNEKDDLKSVVSYLRATKQVSCIGLWGRSMGAVTSILYGAEDPSIAGMVLDSPFSNLFDLMMEMVDVYKIRLPKFTVKVALQIMRRIIQKRAQFDIMDLNVTQVSLKTFIPALFGHATEDLFIQPHHSDCIYKAYAGDKNIIKFEGDHNSPRPKFYYDSVTIFFHNVLHPPEAPASDFSYDSMYYGPDALRMQEDFDEGLICNVVNEFQPSFSVPVMSIPQSEHSEDVKCGVGSASEVLQESCTELKINENTLLESNSGQPTEVFELMKRADGSGEPSESSSLESIMQKGDCHIDDCFSYPSSNGASTESWGRCSSHGVSENSGDGSPPRQNFADAPINPDDEERMIMEAIAASLQDVSLKDAIETATVQNGNTGTERTRKKKLESFSQRLKLSRLKGIGSIRKSTT